MTRRDRRAQRAPHVVVGGVVWPVQGAQVAIVDAQNRIHLRNVTLGQNLGKTVQVTSGVSPSDKLVNNPPAGLLEGQSVQPVTPVTGYASATQKTQAQPAPADAAGEHEQASTP